MKFDMHIHSKYSKDSFLSPNTIIKDALKKGLDGVAITDHNTIKGGLATQKINNDKDFTVIVGSEIKTEHGDVIGLFLNEEIISRNFIEVVAEIKNQGGLVVLAHPFRNGFAFPKYLLNAIDIIEVLNARSTKSLNIEAFSLAKQFNKPINGGSDAHLGFEIGRVKTIIKGDIRSDLMKKRAEIEGEESIFYFVHGLSVMIEKIKEIM